MMGRVSAFAAALLSTAGIAEASCLLPNSGLAMSGAGAFAAAVRFNPAPVTVGAPFALDLSICSSEGAKIERVVIDARMPAHRHGMNYKPEITPKGNGAFEAKGFLFHMPGKWEIMLSVSQQASGKPQQLTLELDVR
jgi:hypothetical protein